MCVVLFIRRLPFLLIIIMFCILVLSIINVFIFLFIYFYTGPILIAVFVTEMVILFKHIIIIIIVYLSAFYVYIIHHILGFVHLQYWFPGGQFRATLLDSFVLEFHWLHKQSIVYCLLFIVLFAISCSKQKNKKNI